MEFINEIDFQELLGGPLGKYYEGRWAYFSEVVNIVRETEGIDSVLEIGPSFRTIVKDCDIMVKPENDVWGRPQKYVRKIYEHDARDIPWPIRFKEYDLFIALQVWEHLEGKQKEAFKEVMRTCRMAILSFPYMWDCPKDDANYPEHHMIDEKIISEWTLGIEPEKVVKIPRTGDRVSKGPRIIYFWKF
ncbi:MAG: hypothetical protein BWY11_02451 [Firmicutes bacterium ADurb.Bin182]|nr:MAG: hypothetical protein BWY11_02451 [Firmicutes bacterium ADurb.Bin182]